MLLSGISYLFSSAGISKSLNSGFVKIEAFKSIKTKIILVCKACQENMASIPPSAFSAGRIRETQRDMKISNIKKGVESTKYFPTKLMELTPQKYISKLMNSIWGSYNRYSPHNVKKINDAITFNAELQQSAVNSPKTNETMIFKLWESFNASHSP